MELVDSIWNEEFSISDVLDYEFDENDLYKEPEDDGQIAQTMKNEDSKEQFIQSNLDTNLAFNSQNASAQADHNKFALEEITSCTSFTNGQNSMNVTPASLNSSHELTDGGKFIKTEIKRRDSVESDVFNMDKPSIVIDARIFLDSYEGKKEYVDAVPSLNDEFKLNSVKKTSFTPYNQCQKLLTNKKAIDKVASKSDKKHAPDSTKVSPKSDRKRIKLIDFVMPNVGKKKQQNNEKNNVKGDRKRKYFPESQNENLILGDTTSALKANDKISNCVGFDEKKTKSKHSAIAVKRQKKKPYCLPLFTCDEPAKKLKPQDTHNRSLGTNKEDGAVLSNIDKIHSQEKINVKLDIKQKKHESFINSKVERKNEKRINLIPDIKERKKVDYVHSTFVTDKKSKIQTKIKVESNNILSNSPKMQKELENVDFEPNLKSDADKKKLDSKQSSSNKPQANSEAKLDSKSFPKTEKPQAKDKETSVPEAPKKFLRDKKNPITVKRETGHSANLKGDPSLKYDQLQPKLVLKRIPDYIAHGISVRTEFAAVKPKAEILDEKPLLRLNSQQLPKARIILKRLTDADLQSPARLLSRVKTEMNENVSQKLRSQGRARDKDYIRLYCCKCKNWQVERSQLSKTKYCNDCGFQLIYLCVKCNDKHYMNYNHLFRHLKICQGSGETKRVGLDSIVLHRCTQCTFKTTYAQVMGSHCKTMGHKADGEVDIDAMDKREKARVKRGSSKIKREVPDSPKIPRTKYAKLIVRQNETSIAPVTERYCVKCQKSYSSKTRKPKESCRKCKAPLQLRCLKCNLTRKSYDAMFHHLRSKCCPNSYRCAKCDYTNSTWSLMQMHAMEQHDNTSAKSARKAAKKKKRRREIFPCELCTFQTNYKHNIGRHMKAVHKK